MLAFATGIPQVSRAHSVVAIVASQSIFDCSTWYPLTMSRAVFLVYCLSRFFRCFSLCVVSGLLVPDRVTTEVSKHVYVAVVCLETFYRLVAPR